MTRTEAREVLKNHFCINCKYYDEIQGNKKHPMYTKGRVGGVCLKKAKDSVFGYTLLFDGCDLFEDKKLTT